jgi:maleylacetate reductase
MAKAVALDSGQPIVAIPTTYSGSEATPVWGLTVDAVKTTGIDPVVQPRSVIYDPELTYGMPIRLTVVSGLNALAHSVEALWAPGGTPVSDAFALTSIESLARGLRRVMNDGDDGEARRELLVGAWLAGAAFAVAGSGLHHKVCHALGGAFNLPHADTHAIVLPHVMAFNLAALPETEGLILQRLNAAGLKGGSATEAMHSLVRELDAPTQLRAVGLESGQLEKAVDIVLAKVPAENPRPMSREQVSLLLGAAFDGEPPQSFT